MRSTWQIHLKPYHGHMTNRQDCAYRILAVVCHIKKVVILKWTNSRIAIEYCKYVLQT